MTIQTNDLRVAAQVSSQDAAEWETETAEAIEIEGYSLYGGKKNDKTLDSLIGVPFLIKHATFRRGDITPEGWEVPADYVSCEVLIHPGYASSFPRKYVVFNDGSTGIYRQVMAALAARDFIVLDESLPEEGEANATRYDVPLSGADGKPAEFRNLRLLCPEGLRSSEYDNPNGGGKSKTWYLA